MNDESKTRLIKAFIARFEADLIVLKEAALATHDAATNEESKPENEYDTRALEASYLAGAQSKRVAELQDVLQIFKNLKLILFAPDDQVQNTALIDIQIDGKPSTVFFLPKGGGESLQFENKTIQIVTPESVLGSTLKGMRVGDSTTFEVGPKVRELEVIEIY